MFIVYAAKWIDFVYYQDSPMSSDLDIALLTLATLFIAAHGSTVIYLYGFHTYLLSFDRTSVEHRCCKGVKPGCNHDKGIWANFFETFGSLEGMCLYLLPVASVRCLSETRNQRKRVNWVVQRPRLGVAVF